MTKCSWQPVLFYSFIYLPFPGNNLETQIWERADPRLNKRRRLSFAGHQVINIWINTYNTLTFPTLPMWATPKENLRCKVPQRLHLHFICPFLIIESLQHLAYILVDNTAAFILDLAIINWRAGGWNRIECSSRKLLITIAKSGWQIRAVNFFFPNRYQNILVIVDRINGKDHEQKIRWSG